MGVVIGLLCCTVVLMSAAPALLSRARWCTRRPGRALALWCSAYLGGVACALVSLGWALSIGLAAQRSAAGPQPRVLSASAIVIFCWVGLGSVGALVSLVVTRSEPLTAEHRRVAALLTLLAGAAAYRTERLGRVSVVYVDSDRPMAVSLPGSDPRIVVTSRVEDELTPGQLRAVIEHERAHLVWRHGWIAVVAHLNATCTPVLPGARQLHRATRLLVELAADDAAARVCGDADLAEALSRLAAVTDDEGMVLRARRAAARCGPPVPGSGRLRRTGRVARSAPEGTR